MYSSPGGSYEGPPFADPNGDATWIVQVTVAALGGEQVEWMLDRIRGALLGRTGSDWTTDLDGPSWAVMTRAFDGQATIAEAAHDHYKARGWKKVGALLDDIEAADLRATVYAEWTIARIEAEITARNNERDEADQIVVVSSAKKADLIGYLVLVDRRHAPA